MSPTKTIENFDSDIEIVIKQNIKSVKYLCPQLKQLKNFK